MKKKMMWMAGLTAALVLMLCLAGCGDENAAELQEETYAETEAAADSDADAYEADSSQLIVELIADGRMGEEWNRMFAQGVQDQLDEINAGLYVKTADIAGSSAAEMIDQAAAESYDGLLLAFDVSQEDADDAIAGALEKGVAIVSFADRMDNGYNTAAPEEMGKNMAQALVARIAVQKGSTEWEDSDDFSRQLSRAVQGMWTVANSSGDKKQFFDSYVMEFSRNESTGLDELNRVSLIEEIRDAADRKGYDYVLNTGNYYSLFPETPSMLECHWEPDGYSMSDSLIKTEESNGEEGDTNSSFVFNMDSYNGTEEYFGGSISGFTGYDSFGRPEDCFALNLSSPVRVTYGNGEDTLIHSIQLNAQKDLSGYAEQDGIVKVTGILIEAHTNHHYTPILLNVNTVE